MPTATPAELPVRTATAAELDAVTLYDLLRLRVDVFVVEQDCAYPELDGRDLEPSTLHCWIADDDGAVLGYLRVLREPGGGTRIGRVVTARSARGGGVAARLLLHGLQLAAPPVRIHAQAHLAEWYARFGFSVSGRAFVEDGIAHVPMALPTELPASPACLPSSAAAAASA